jgi:N-acetylneuraminic acid mutarotase
VGKAATGATDSVEIIDLESPTTTCRILPDFPTNVTGAIGGLGFQDNPIICGGLNASTSYTNKCYSFNVSEWIPSPNMMSAKAYAAVSVSPNRTTSTKLFVTGGLNSSSFLNTIESLTPDGWKTLPPFLPVNIHMHCSVFVNSTTLMVIGGIQNEVYSPLTYYLNTDSNFWVSGPTLNIERCQQGCGKIRKDRHSSEFSIIVAGGSNGLNWRSTVELLDGAAFNWRMGPRLPMGILSSKMVEDPNGGVILIGGLSDSNVYENSLFQLAHGGEDAVWTKMDQKLKIGRYWHVAFLVPDYMVDCS